MLHGKLGSKHIMALKQCHYPDDAYFRGNFLLLDFQLKKRETEWATVPTSCMIDAPFA